LKLTPRKAADRRPRRDARPGRLAPGGSRVGELVYPQEGHVRDIGYFGAPASRAHAQGASTSRGARLERDAARGVYVYLLRVPIQGYGTLVIVDHGAGYETLRPYELLVSSGDQVRVGPRSRRPRGPGAQRRRARARARAFATFAAMPRRWRRSQSSSGVGTSPSRTRRFSTSSVRI